MFVIRETKVKAETSKADILTNKDLHSHLVLLCKNGYVILPALYFSGE